MHQKWKFENIKWSLFDPEKVNPDLLRIIKAGSVVEHNGSDYGIYLDNVFQGDAVFQKEIVAWSKDEIKHGRVLAEWVKKADPTYNFEDRFKDFVDKFPVDTQTKDSIRGSRAAELLTRCMVEIATSSFYSAVSDAADEPLLKHICAKISADELRHYKLFYTHLQRYQKIENMTLFKRFKVAAGRLFENEGDELALAYYTANEEKGPYDRAYCTKRYGQVVYRSYQKIHVDRAMALFCKAIGVAPRGWLQKLLSAFTYGLLSRKAKAYARSAAS